MHLSTTLLSTRRGRPFPGSKRCVVAPETGPFNALAACKSVLVVADVENWAYSARDLGLRIDFAELARLISQNVIGTSLHAWFSISAENASLALQFYDMGWFAHPRSIIKHDDSLGGRQHANADVWLAFGAAVALQSTNADGCVIGTGDGALGLDIARGIRTEFPACTTVVTLSVAGSTSRLLDAKEASEVDGNLEIGMDVMYPLYGEPIASKQLLARHRRVAWVRIPTKSPRQSGMMSPSVPR